MRVLIAEDNRGSRIILENILKDAGYSVISASDGKEAWEILCRNPDIRLLITDLVMPNMDGMELCRRIRSRQEGPYVYITMLTAHANEDTLMQSMDAGADDFLGKPVKTVELGARLRAGHRIVELELAQEMVLKQLQEAYDQICRDLQSAAKIQHDLLPRPGKIGRIDFGWRFYPSNFIAGDIFNCFRLNQDYVAFYQLDVAGRGVGAALLSFSLHQRLVPPSQNSVLLDDAQQPVVPSRVLTRLNENFQSSEVTQYFTIVYGYIHFPSGRVCVSQAGHPPPLWLRRDLPPQACGDSAPPLGMSDDAGYEDLEFELFPGDRLFVYSDGLIECGNRHGELFSQARLEDLLTEGNQLSLDELLQAMEAALFGWRGESFFDDDTSFLVLEYT